jgi:hypothetical protein
LKNFALTFDEGSSGKTSRLRRAACAREARRNAS